MRSRCLISILTLILLLISASFSSARTKDEALAELKKRRLSFDHSTFIRLLKQGESEKLTLFLDAGMDPDTRDRSEGATAIMLAMKRVTPEVIERFINSSVDLDAANNSGITALMTATKVGRTDVVKMLINKGVEIDLADERELTALVYAAKSGNTAIITLLADAGADMNKITSEGYTPLIYAAKKKYTRVITLLLEKGADPEIKNPREGYPIFMAVNDDSPQVLTALLNGGADPNLKDRGIQTALMVAAFSNKKSIVKELLNNKKVEIDAVDNYNETALIKSVYQGYYEIAQLLIYHGADVNFFNEQSSALLVAVDYYGDYPGGDELIDMLLKKGADVTLKRKKSGKTALDIAKKKNLTALVKKLERYVEKNKPR